MIKSMTAYGRYTFTLKNHKLTFEIHSLNKKGLDISIFLPKDMFFLDIEIRKWIAQSIHRGQVTVRLNKDISFQDISNLLPDPSSLKKIKSDLMTLSQNLGYESHSISFQYLLELTEKMTKPFEEDISLYLDEVKEGFYKAKKNFLDMKEKEGQALKKDILDRLRACSLYREEIEKLAEREPEKFQERLEQKIQKLGPICDDNKERIAREVVLFADKVDISEELARLQSHIDQFLSYLELDQVSIGKTLEFLLLEMSRETNTILSKTSLLEITKVALKMKPELEKMREQIQNIE